MSRREYVSRFRCAEPDCNEWSHFVSSTRREEDQVHANQQRKPWRCYRHTGADTLLSLDTPERVTVMTAERVQTDRGNVLPTLYWDGTVDVVSAPGFKAFAKDFPPGTRLIVTARIELPEPAEEPGPAPILDNDPPF